MDADTMAEVEPREYVTLTGYPDDDESRWHVNKAVEMGTPERVNLAIVLQAANADPHWLAIILTGGPNNWTVDKMHAFEGEKPDNPVADDHANDIDPDEVTVMSIGLG